MKQPGRSIRIIAFAITLGVIRLTCTAQAADGDLDLGFGSGGKIVLPGLAGDAATAAATQSDGKIVVAGVAFGPDFPFPQVLALVRYNTDGNLDTTFGAGGIAVTDIQTNIFFPDNYSRFDIAIQNDGKIVVVGAFGSAYTPTDFGVARFDTNGNPDPTFGVGGKVTTDFFGNSDAATSVALQSDGKIVVAGYARDSYADFALARYDASGNLDATFGVGGKLTTDFFGFENLASGVAIQSDGKIVVAGSTAPDATYRRDFAVARYDANGNLDPTFGSGGKATVDISESDEASAVAIQPSDGKIIVAGAAIVPNGYGAFFDFALVRFDTSGNPDPAFGVGGKVLTDFYSGIDFAYDVALQKDGKIVAAGFFADPTDVELKRDFALARYDTGGNLDPTFGIGGKVITDFSATDSAQAIALQPDCKIVAAGYSWQIVTGGDLDFALARYDSSGCLVAGPCPRSQGDWKNHPSIWPVNSLTLGSQSYTKAELLAILNTSTQTDASLILARQLIAAKLNIASGSDPTPVAGTVAHADSLLGGFGGKLPYKVKSSASAGQAMVADASVLNNYNNALLTPGCNP
jgi:uncharacterized delta-60 repeat protein